MLFNECLCCFHLSFSDLPPSSSVAHWLLLCWPLAWRSSSWAWSPDYSVCFPQAIQRERGEAKFSIWQNQIKPCSLWVISSPQSVNPGISYSMPCFWLQTTLNILMLYFWSDHVRKISTHMVTYESNLWFVQLIIQMAVNSTHFWKPENIRRYKLVVKNIVIY